MNEELITVSPAENNAVIVLSEKDIRSQKVAACAVSLGVAILKEMIGDSISKANNEHDINELMATAILSDLNI